MYKIAREMRGPTRGLTENPTVTSDTKAVNMQRNYWLRKLHGETVGNYLPSDNPMGKVIMRLSDGYSNTYVKSTQESTPQGKVT